jgi:hypothetical protein
MPKGLRKRFWPNEPNFSCNSAAKPLKRRRNSSAAAASQFELFRIDGQRQRLLQDVSSDAHSNRVVDTD